MGCCASFQSLSPEDFTPMTFFRQLLLLIENLGNLYVLRNNEKKIAKVVTELDALAERFRSDQSPAGRKRLAKIERIKNSLREEIIVPQFINALRNYGSLPVLRLKSGAMNRTHDAIVRRSVVAEQNVEDLDALLDAIDVSEEACVLDMPDIPVAEPGSRSNIRSTNRKEEEETT